MTEIRVERDYPHTPAKVWRALTDPALMALWGMRPEGFVLDVGTRFRLVGQPNPQWRGWVECEVLEIVPLGKLRLSWDFDGKMEMTYVTYSLAPHGGGTRFAIEHTGFTSAASTLVVQSLTTEGWTKCVDVTFPAVLADLDEVGTLRRSSTLKPFFPAET